MDDATTVQQLRDRMAEFVRERDWEQFHRPKNLAMSIAIEAAELMEHFQWVTHEQADELLEDPALRQEVSDEVADILCYLLSMANATGLDLSEAFETKLAKTRRKYPKDLVRGRYAPPRQDPPE
ncbi:MAG: nucleotide pyrophosphohydrolase [Phycisphaerae bacterium]